MKNKILFSTFLSSVALIGVNNTVFAAPAVATQNPTLICPSINVIKKNPNPAKGTWFAQTPTGSWKSYDMSFATNLTKFVGAQWTGEKVGQITCIYRSEQKFRMQGVSQTQPTLPVLLVFHTLTFQPTGGKWTVFKKNGRVVHGVRNCNSFKRHDCSFQMHMKKPVGNILKEAESLKFDSASDSNPVASE